VHKTSSDMPSPGPSIRAWIPAPAFLTLVFLTLSTTPTIRAQPNVSVLTFGARADGILRTDGAMSAGSAVLTSASGSFSSLDIGKYIQVVGAGPGVTSHLDGSMQSGSTVLNSATGTFTSSDVGRGIVVLGGGLGGGNLVTAIQNYTSPTSVTLNTAAQSSVSNTPYYYGAMTLEGSIQSVQSTTTVTLNTPAVAPISNAMFAYGTNNNLAFQSALDSVGQAGGGTVSVPAPTSCPAGAVCGYVTAATDQMTARAPGAIKIRFNNISLIGDAPQTNLFCRGAWKTYTNSVSFGSQTATIRGTCVALGDDGGSGGSAGTSVSNITLANLHLYGMTNGNTYSVNFTPTTPPLTTTGDGWDETHKAIYMWDNSSFSNITINSVYVQDFKGENIYSGGSTVTGMLIQNSTLTNFNGDGISMLAADLQVLNNTISNGSNAGVENSTRSVTSAALVRQIYQSNTVSFMQREGINIVGVDGGVAAGYVQIVNNYLDTIGQIHGNGARAAVYVNPQSLGNVAPSNVTVSGNTCHDCYSFGTLATGGNTQVTANTFIVDKYNCSSFMTFMNALTNITISNNTGSRTSNAIANSINLGAVYMIDPGYQSGSFVWNNANLQNNVWNFSGMPNYTFVTSSGLGFNIIGHYNLTWQGESCPGCSYPDRDHGLVTLGPGTTIEPYGPVVYVTGNSGPVTATVDASKEQDGSEVQIVNAGSNPVSFVTDSNLSLASSVTLPGGVLSSATFVYHASIGKFTLSGGTGSVVATAGTPQSTGIGSAFSIALQVTVTDSGGNPVSGATVTFTAPTYGAGAAFGGSATASVTTNASGVATAPTLTANGVAGSYVVTAAASGVAAAATFNLTNTGMAGGGSLQGYGTSSAAAINLTAEGGADWVHWGDGTLTRKAGVSAQLSNDSQVGNGTVLTYLNDLRPIGWTDGTPVSGSSNNTNGIYISGVGQGFSFTAPADTTQRTLAVHVGGYNSSGTLTAHLSDGSAPDFTDATAVVTGQYDRNYNLTYRAVSAGTLIVTWQMTSGSGNVTLNGAALAGANVVATGGTPQSAAVNTAFPTALQVTVSDATGNLASGATVTFSAPSSGASGTFAGSATASSITNPSGVATAPTLTANSQTGSYTVKATVAGVTTPANFILTNTAGAAASIAANAGTPQTATESAAFATALQATVEDSGGNPVSGATVTFTAPASGASGTFGGSAKASSITNASGVATAPTLTANSQIGSYTITASVAGVTTPASFSLTNTAGAAASIMASAGTPQSATESAVFATALQATVKDSGGNAVSGATVTFTAPSSGASGTFGGSASVSSITNANGVAIAPTLTANAQAGSYAVTANVAGVTNPASFSLTNTAAAGAGLLEGTATSATTAVNLTAEGSVDWVHWGDGSLNRKAGVVQRLSTYTAVGSGTVLTYNNDLRSMSWTDGSPSASSTNNRNGIYIRNVGQGFSLTSAADTSTRTIVVHAGGWSSGGTLTAHPSDGSAADFTDITPMTNGQYDRNYTLTYRAASAGQTLTITWKMTSGNGNVVLDGAALH
jgi:hypothetical protein